MSKPESCNHSIVRQNNIMLAARHGWEISVCSEHVAEKIRQLLDYDGRSPLSVWIDLDTGNE